jgi:hypothetical protein
MTRLLQPRLWTERGGRGDLVGVLTGVGDQCEEAGFQPAAEGQRRHPAARAPVAGPLWGARLKGRRAGLALRCTRRHMDVEARCGPRAPASRELVRSPAMEVDRTERGKKEQGLDWYWPPNVHGNGKTERDRWGEPNGVLTFGQRSTMATEGLAGVGEESPESGKTTESTLDSRDWPYHGIELDEGNSKVVSFCTGSAWFRQKSSPEVRRNLVDAKVRRGFVAARVIETERGWRRWKEDAEEIIGSYLLAEIESDFIFPFF